MAARPCRFKSCAKHHYGPPADSHRHRTANPATATRIKSTREAAFKLGALACLGLLPIPASDEPILLARGLGGGDCEIRFEEVNMRGLMRGTIVIAVVAGLSQWGLGAAEADRTIEGMKSMSATDLEKAGDACRAQKDYQGAIRYFDEALRKDKRNAVLYNKLGMAELTSGDVQSARVDFAKAVKTDKKYADAFNNLGAVFFIQNSFSRAARYFSRAVALDATRAPFHINLGAAWFSENKLDRAMNEYSSAL